MTFLFFLPVAWCWLVLGQRPDDLQQPRSRFFAPAMVRADDDCCIGWTYMRCGWDPTPDNVPIYLFIATRTPPTYHLSLRPFAPHATPHATHLLPTPPALCITFCLFYITHPHLRVAVVAKMFTLGRWTVGGRALIPAAHHLSATALPPHRACHGVHMHAV